jgi:hypothetical protein
MKKLIKKLAYLCMPFFSFLFVSINSGGQPLTDYQTKISYVEVKEVKYFLTSETDYETLSIAEISKYHGYTQMYTMDEYIDLDGELLTDQKFILEYNVRDEWMEGYSRIVLGKNTIDIYGTENGLLYQTDRVYGDDDTTLTAQQAAQYGLYQLDMTYYNQLLNQLQSLGFVVNQSNFMLSASKDLLDISYDHNSKTASTVLYDSNGVKTQESMVEYVQYGSGDNYYPALETLTEWFLSENGCCVQKQTQISRYQYERDAIQSPPQSGRMLADIHEEKTHQNSTSDFHIIQEANTNGFRVKSQSHSQQELQLKVFDMSGKIVLETRAIEGEFVHLPTSQRSGMYLVHIYHANMTHPVIGKLIKTQSGFQF